ncbi:DUF6285 domain-containing protein [Neoroseomonas oryzicola]|uniref:DUF6285 domain-containing protein n=1 Tax=Neoroseomonas oryzicola TaxID=535904 RepID=A0A9X9WME7_9PROT|nr:DUF6285 domain-containing protein [Neoroseomonas oryzicola]MBR0661507.1 hypothetical protein [Neoroseomonas oryzicola]NKE19081.1 hypothetical protein [Neoroseomonas oryzicola]
MLSEEPEAADLLATAREVLLNELLPALPPDKAFAARMVANAMAIAARDAAQDAWEPETLARMAALAGDPRAFAAAIRAGRFDPGTPDHGAAAALLDDLTRARCVVSAPRALGKG